MTENFLLTWMRNDNGTFATYLQDDSLSDDNVATGREALSESLGLWMQYALLKKDRSLFDDSYHDLTSFFLDENGGVYWKLKSDGSHTVTTNALVDDLRIIDALNRASRLWKDNRYRETATKIGTYVVNHQLKNHLLVDFYDSAYDDTADTVTLSYVDVSGLQECKRLGLLSDNELDAMTDLLAKQPDDETFAPLTYDMVLDSYGYNDEVNMIDQLLIALNKAKAGMSTDAFYSFVKSAFYQEHRLYGRYDRNTQQPAVDYESLSVYGILILYALEQNDNTFAYAVYQRMVQFKQQDIHEPYPGGYVFDGNTHFFDNIYPLLAEKTLENKYIISN